MKKVITLVAVVGFCCTAALADGPTASLETPHFKAVKAVARIAPDMRRISPWYELGDGGISAPQSTELLFDAFEPNATGVPTDGLYGINCGVGGGRYLLSTESFAYCNTAFVDDITVKPGAEGADADRLEWLWRWCGDEVNESDLSVIFTTEDFDDTCTGPPYANVFDGVIYSFGAGTEGFWYTDVDLSGSGLFHHMPDDGSGGYIHFLAVGSTNTAIIINDCEYCDDGNSGPQPGLWGSKGAGEVSGNGTAPWDAGPIKWDDDFPNDASWAVNECYDTTGFIPCPDPMQNTMCFYKDLDVCAGELCGDASCDGTFNGGDINPFFTGLTDPAAWQSTYPDCDLMCTLDINYDGSINGGDINPFFNALTAGSCPPRP
jgi:hypothetical protein